MTEDMPELTPAQIVERTEDDVNGLTMLALSHSSWLVRATARARLDALELAEIEAEETADAATCAATEVNIGPIFRLPAFRVLEQHFDADGTRVIDRVELLPGASLEVGPGAGFGEVARSDDLRAAEKTASATHELTITTGAQTGTIGRCSCRLFSMVGPRDQIEAFHADHLRDQR
jgi:hypothetical protein